MLRTSLRASLRAPIPQPTLQSLPHRCISNNPRIIRRNVLRKMKQGRDRLRSQGPDPAEALPHGWRLASAAVVERYPLIIPDIDAFESEYRTGRFLEMQRRARRISPDIFLSERDKIEGRTEPNLDDPRAALYTPAPRRTKADETGDRRSMERALDEKLYLVVKRTEGAKHMQFPQVLVSDEAVTMGRYAEQAYRGVTLPESRPAVHFISKGPSCHLEHVYPSKYREKHGVYGVKIFFFRAMLMGGELNAVRNAVDYAWARDCELEELVGEEYYRAIKPMLVGVGPTVHNVEEGEGEGGGG